MTEPGTIRIGNQVFLGHVPDPEQEVLTPDDETISDPRAEHATTRKVLRPELIPENRKDATARVSVMLTHQRRGATEARAGARWRDVEAVPLSKLHKDEKVALSLSGRETKRLFQALVRLYKRRGDLNMILDELGFTIVEGGGAVVFHGPERELVKRWLEEEGEDFFGLVEEIRPGMFDTVLLRRDHQKKQAALEEFRSQLDRNVWSERDWETFFRRNRWIFGYGLSYHFLTPVHDQPNYGGVEVTGRGTQRGDVLLRTEAEMRFTVLVELKKPSTDLLEAPPYRGQHIYRVSEEIAGGVAQLQANCATWFKEGSARPEWIVEQQAYNHIHTHEPKGILVAGHTRELGTDMGKVGSFERFRRSLHNPEILTYDELFERASYLVEVGFEEAEAGELGDRRLPVAE